MHALGSGNFLLDLWRTPGPECDKFNSQNLTDAQKQEMGETFIYNQVVQDATYVDAMKRGDNAMVQRLADAAVTRFQKEMNVNLRTLKITNNGFSTL
jgi:hypothetical protein